MSKENILAVAIVELFGGKENIMTAAHCMTRLRLTPSDTAKADIEGIKRLAGVLGVVEQGGQYQIILGPGTVTKVANALTSNTGIRMGEASDLAATMRDLKAKQGLAKRFLRTLANVFVPIIPAIIASALINGITTACVETGIFPMAEWVKMLLVMGSAIFAYLGIIVGMNAAREFGGTPSMGGLVGALMITPEIANIAPLGIPLTPGRGGLLGILLVVWFMCFVERRLRKVIPNSLDIIFNPLLTLLITGFSTYFILQPISGVLSDIVIWFFVTMTSLSTTVGANGTAVGYLVDFVAGMTLAGVYLPLVTTGLHHGIEIINIELINKFGVSELVPILAMGGAGQIGAVLAVYCKTKNEKIKAIIKAGVPTGLLGIGEPLIYGVTLPLGKPFITACLGAAMGGAFQCVMNTQAIGFGISGLPLIILIKQGFVLKYIGGMFTAYIFGFIFTYFVKFNDVLED